MGGVIYLLKGKAPEGHFLLIYWQNPWYSVYYDSPNFLQDMKKNISWNVASVNLNVIQIKEYQLKYLEHVLLLVWMKWKIWNMVKWSRYAERTP